MEPSIQSERPLEVQHPVSRCSPGTLAGQRKGANDLPSRSVHGNSITPNEPEWNCSGVTGQRLMARASFASPRGNELLHRVGSVISGRHALPRRQIRIKKRSFAGARSVARTPTLGSRASFREKGCLSGTRKRSRQRDDFLTTAARVIKGSFSRSRSKSAR